MSRTLRSILSIVMVSFIVAGFVAMARADHDQAPQAPRWEEPQTP